ncbi:MAG: DNA primase [Hyphomonadaceae bacterium]|nr:DNA primase [Hyphomonadaceae bacterium]GIK50077.1 MAG: DNA primase [Alphaproteobacteria bacterium]
MRFSDTLLRQVRDRVSIADYAGKRLSWHKQKSRPSAGDYWACCPFHQEKSPSFHVLDQKGLFKCFGCGEKGDVFTLAMKLEGLSFPEAVEKFADIAGVQLPKDEYEDRGENDRRKRLYAVTAGAAKLFAGALRSSGGAEARRYLQGRGLGPEEWERFGIGFAPDEWTWTIDKLKAEGFTLEEIVAAGVAREGDEGKRAIDTFRGRITFEITDTAGKAIGFGGRLLDPNAKAAKYINSPETALYSKSRVLYRLKQARELLAKTKAPGLVVGEGYLDVIAFERAGVAAVAPCGTALTEDQLQLLWRAGGEPTLCFDGDSAGQRAAARALDLALPHLSPTRTVRIAHAPAGQDPDDIFRSGGAEALAALIAAASPASDALFEREKNRRPLDTPEARAAFQAALRDAANRIADKDTQRAYFSELMRRANEALRPPRQPWQPRQPGGAYQRSAPAPATAELKAIAAAPRPRPAAENFLRAAVDYPGILGRFADWIERLHMDDPDLEAIRSALLQLSDAEFGAETTLSGIDRNRLSLHLTRSGQERAAARLSRWPKPRPAADDGELEAEWLALATREVVLPAIREELAELKHAAAEGDDAAFVRFQALSREARAIEARAREAKDTTTDTDEADGLVA